jgi:prepilin peptidase CpaA
MMTIASVLTLLTASVALGAGVMDIFTRRVPNWLTLPSAAALLLLQFLAGGAHALGAAIIAVLVAGGVFLLFFMAGGMGGGDVKLIAALAAGIGLPNTGALLMLTAIVGGIMAVMLALRHGKLRSSLANVGTIAMHHCYAGFEPHPDLHVYNPRTLRLPYAVAIAAGTLLTLALKGMQG